MPQKLAITDAGGGMPLSMFEDSGAARRNRCDAGTGTPAAGDKRTMRAVEATALIQPSRPGRTTAGRCEEQIALAIARVLVNSMTSL